MDELFLEGLHAKMRKADWFFDFSDDMSVYRNGLSQQQEIIKGLGELPMRRALWFIHAYVPKDVLASFMVRLNRKYSIGD